MEFDRIGVPATVFQELAEKAKLDKTESIQKWTMAASISKNPEIGGALASFLNAKAAQQFVRGKPFYVPSAGFPTNFDPRGRQAIPGQIDDADLPLVLPLDDGAFHLGLWGASGTGKTHLLRRLISQLRPHATVWIFDREKGDFLDGARDDPDVVAVDANEDLDNPMEVPPGVSPQRTLTSFVSVFSKSSGLLVASQSLLLETVHELFAERDIFDGSQNFPVMRELREKIASKKFGGRYRSAQARDSLLNRLDAMLLECPRAYSYRKGFQIAQLAETNMVTGLGSLSEHHARFRAMSRATALFNYRMANGQRENRLRNWLVFDEAAWLAKRSGRVEDLGWAPLADVLRVGREAGIGMCFASQTANLDDAVMENVRARFVFRLGNGLDVERIERALGLDSEQAEYVSKLGTGTCVVSIPEHDPFLLKVPWENR